MSQSTTEIIKPIFLIIIIKQFLINNPIGNLRYRHFFFEKNLIQCCKMRLFWGILKQYVMKCLEER